MHGQVSAWNRFQDVADVDLLGSHLVCVSCCYLVVTSCGLIVTFYRQHRGHGWYNCY